MLICIFIYSFTLSPTTHSTIHSPRPGRRRSTVRAAIREIGKTVTRLGISPRVPRRPVPERQHGLDSLDSGHYAWDS